MMTATRFEDRLVDMRAKDSNLDRSRVFVGFADGMERLYPSFQLHRTLSYTGRRNHFRLQAGQSSASELVLDMGEAHVLFVTRDRVAS